MAKRKRPIEDVGKPGVKDEQVRKPEKSNGDDDKASTPAESAIAHAVRRAEELGVVTQDQMARIINK